MIALSIKQPWAWAILHAGKDIENRTWPTIFLGHFYIHASIQFDFTGFYWLYYHPNLLTASLPPPSSMQRGGIVGTSNLIDCVRSHPSPFFSGPFGFVLSDSKPIDFIPCHGKSMFYSFSDTILNL